MDAFEIYYIVFIYCLILLTLFSHIIIALCSCGWEVKAIFCAISATVLAMCLALALVFMGVLSSPITARLYELRNELAITLPAMILTVSSASELTGMIHMLMGRGDRKEAIELKVECDDYALPVSVRKAGVRMHGDYKISDGE